MTDAERREIIRRRQVESLPWRIIHLLGSLKLALALLATIALACAVASFYESKFNTEVAQAYIYKAPWFLLWLGVLCVNLAAAALTRWPWQRRHTGFVVTHAGIITLLIGAMIGMKMGYEANITLRKGERPADRLILNQTVLQVRSPKDGASYLIDFPVERPRISPERPRTLHLPDTKAKLVVDDYTEFLAEVPVIVPGEGGRPGVQLTFRSGMMSQEIPIRLLLEREEREAVADFFGRAVVRLVEAMPEAAVASEAVLPPGVSAVSGSVASKERGITDETHVVFFDKQPVVHTHRGPPGEIEFRLVPSRDGSDVGKRAGWMLLARVADGTPMAFPLDAVLGRTAEIQGYQITVREFWPDFVMRDGKPESASDEIKNPAVLVSVAGRRATTDGQPDAVGEASKLELVIAPSQSPGVLEYRILRGGVAYSSGTAQTGDEVGTGWADWKFTVDVYEKNAMEHRELSKVANSMDGTAIPAIRARLREPDGREGKPVWIRSGRGEEVIGAKQVVFTGFGLRTQPVPFTVSLLDFQVPRDEGTDTPADFIATLAFRDLKSGHTVQRTSRMNHPASYPGNWWNVMTGINYKFSQASWNPDNLNETTLQVLYDPGWLFKWIGSAMICTGIFIMFYFKPYAAKKSVTQSET